jgi:hypothetical protein
MTPQTPAPTGLVWDAPGRHARLESIITRAVGETCAVGDVGSVRYDP